MKHEFDEKDNINYHADMYNEYLKEHLRLGLPGVIFGLVAVLIFDIYCAVYVFQHGGNILEYCVFVVLLTIIGPIEGGLLLAGVPYGWRLMNRLLTRWTIYGDIVTLIILFFLKLIFAALIGFFAYPFMLVYYFIRSRKTKREIRAWATVTISAVVMLCAVAGLSVLNGTASSAGDDNDTGISIVKAVNVATFAEQDVLLNQMCQNALDNTKEIEEKNVSNYGWTVADTTRLHGIFFMEANESEHPHYINRSLSLSNAVAVVTGYYLVEAGPSSINQWEMDVRIYPNFSIDADNVLTYDIDSAYVHSLRSDNLAELMEWFRGEYNDMSITEITRP